MSVTRQAWCNHLFCDAVSDLPAAGQFTGQKAWINSTPVDIKQWNGASWTSIITNYPLPSTANIVLARFSKTTVTATTTPTTLASATITGGMMGANSCVVVWIWGTYFNDSGANRGMQMVLKVGGTTLIDAATATNQFGVSATHRRPFFVNLVFKNVGATNVNWAYINYRQANINTGVGTLTTGEGGFYDGTSPTLYGELSCNGESAINTASNQTLDLQVAMNVNTATQEIISEGGVMLLQ